MTAILNFFLYFAFPPRRWERWEAWRSATNTTEAGRYPAWVCLRGYRVDGTLTVARWGNLGTAIHCRYDDGIGSW